LLVSAVDGHCLGERADVEVEQRAQAFRRLDREFRAVRNLAADVIGQPAVREGNVRPSLDHDDVGALGMTAGTCGGGGATGHSADDQQGFRLGFHGSWEVRSG
jgi:hypothetical protein